ncbi:glycosyltransferase family 39 protein, partial [candidate division CSSED10-310 bacterium]
IGFLLFPLLIYVLGKQTLSRPAAFFAALTILLHPIFLNLSLTGYPDHMYNAVALGLLILFNHSFSESRFLIYAGILAGILFLIKSICRRIR